MVGPPRTVDLVVGADGLHSGVRRPLDLDGWGLLHSAPGRTAGLYPLGQTGRAAAVFFFASPPLASSRRDLDQQRRHVAEAFAGS